MLPVASVKREFHRSESISDKGISLPPMYFYTMSGFFSSDKMKDAIGQLEYFMPSKFSFAEWLSGSI